MYVCDCVHLKEKTLGVSPKTKKKTKRFFLSHSFTLRMTLNLPRSQ